MLSRFTLFATLLCWMVACDKTDPCDGDGDGDGFPSAARPRGEAADDACAAAASDCDDGNAAISPAAAEQPYDGVDNDCDATTVDDDLDGDGFILVDDCDDASAAISPAAAEQPYDGVDNDCDATTVDDDVDGDGFLLASDPDDGEPRVPSADLPSGGVELAPCPNFSGVYSGATRLFAYAHNSGSGENEMSWNWRISEMTGDDTVREFKMSVSFRQRAGKVSNDWDRWMRCDADGLWLLYEEGHVLYSYPYSMGYRYQFERIWETEYADGLLVLPADAAPGATWTAPYDLVTEQYEYSNDICDGRTDPCGEGAVTTVSAEAGIATFEIGTTWSSNCVGGRCVTLTSDLPAYRDTYHGMSDYLDPAYGTTIDLRTIELGTISVEWGHDE
jgi:hypothetical protein